MKKGEPHAKTYKFLKFQEDLLFYV